jgi:glycosyltransferase involved in cell wall biosynthesis
MKELKNVIVINDFDYINGGTSQIAINSANILVEKGLNVWFFSAVSDPEKHDLLPEVKRISTRQYDILHDPDRIRAMLNGVWNTKTAQELNSLLKTLDPQESIIHIHGWIKALSASIGHVISQSGLPSVLTLHDYFAACPNGGFFNYQTNSICHLKPMSIECICTHCDVRSYPQKLWRVARQAVQNSIGQIPGSISNFISVTKFSEEILRPYLPPEATIYRIVNPVNYPFDVPRRTDVFTRRLLFIGRLSPEKGAALACEAARMSNSRLTIIGDGELREGLAKQYPEIDFKGWLKPAQVFGEMLRATALVFPSVLYETQGLAVSEAFTVGLPVIVSDQCAASELVNEQNGWLFKSGNVSDLAEKMKSVISDLAGAERMSKSIFEEYWKHPNTVEGYASQLMDTYRMILMKQAGA